MVGGVGRTRFAVVPTCQSSHVVGMLVGAKASGRARAATDIGLGFWGKVVAGVVPGESDPGSAHAFSHGLGPVGGSGGRAELGRVAGMVRAHFFGARAPRGTGVTPGDSMGEAAPAVEPKRSAFRGLRRHADLPTRGGVHVVVVCRLVSFKGRAMRCFGRARCGRLALACVAWWFVAPGGRAQVALVAGVPSDLLLWVHQQVASDRMDADAAQCFLEHMERIGAPWSVEAVRTVTCLTEVQQDLVVRAPAWRAWVESTVASATAPAPPRALRWRTVAWDEGAWRAVSMADVRVGGLRMRVQAHDSTALHGSWEHRWRGTTLAVGAHALPWGHGLTVPRSRPFGDVAFMGGSQAMLQSNPVGRTHGLAHGVFSGGAVSGKVLGMQAGVSGSRHHQTLWVHRPGRSGAEGGASVHRSEGGLAVGAHGRWARGALDVEGAFAAVSISEGLLEWRARSAGRVARGKSNAWQWMAQTSWGSEGLHDAEFRAQWRLGMHEGPWVARGQVRTRMAERDWKGDLQWERDVKWSLTAERSRRSWGVQGSMKGPEVVVVARWDGRPAVVWAGAVHNGSEWGMARALRWTFPVSEGWKAGAIVLDGRGPSPDLRVPAPLLEGVTWVTASTEQARCLVWGARTARGPRGKVTWSGYAFWSPSQQHAFRSALQVTWER